MFPIEAKEEEDGVEDESGCDPAKSVHEDVELRMFEAILLKPLEDFLFLEKIPTVNGRETAPEVDHGREFGHAVLSSVAHVSDLDERDVQVVCFSVNVF